MCVSILSAENKRGRKKIIDASLFSLHQKHVINSIDADTSNPHIKFYMDRNTGWNKVRLPHDEKKHNVEIGDNLQ